MNPTPRRLQIEAMLRDEPEDEFLRYALAMEFSSEGNTEESVRQLLSLIELKKNDSPYIPAYLMAGQGLMKLGRENDAIAVLKAGIAACKPEHAHARGEMQGLLMTLE